MRNFTYNLFNNMIPITNYDQLKIEKDKEKELNVVAFLWLDVLMKFL